ncbi:MAG: glycosyltransferase family 2 protein [Daejeonella sp.]
MIFLYLVFFFLILRFTVTLFNFISNPKLTHSIKKYKDFVSILIPARNEEENIIALLKSIRDQNYKEVEVIVLDDGSTDNTFHLCQTFSANDDRFKIIQGQDLPGGWLGKNFACYQLAKIAKGKYLLFLDADETIADGLIHNAIHRMKTYNLSLLSLFTNQVMLSIGERLVIPMMHFLLLNLLPLRLVQLTKNPAFSAASGQFMLFEARNYHAKQWHEQVKNKVVEDVEIMKLVKGYGFNAEALLANGYISCRMYKSYSEAINGFSKNLLAGFNNNIWGLFLYLIPVISGPFAIAWFLGNNLFFFALSLIILSRMMISLLSGQNAWLNVILHPLQMLSLVIISVISIKKHFSKTITWKGRTISSK